VVGVVAIAGIVTATLLTATLFSTGFTSASRAGVQAQAAAEAGIDYATADLTTCTSGSIVSPVGTSPRFSVTVAHRSVVGAAWTAGCPPTGALEIQLVSTGFADVPGAAGHDRGNSRRMEAVLRAQFNRAVVGDKGIRIAGNVEFLPNGRTAEMSTNGDFRCNGGLIHTDTLYVGGAFIPNNTGNCGRTGPLVQGSAVDPELPINVFPKLYMDDPRWPTDRKDAAWLATRLGWTGDPCSITRTLTSPVVLSSTPVLIDATSCANGLTLSVDGTLSLAADVVIMANKLTTVEGKLLGIKSNDLRPRSLFLVRPWPVERVGGCEDDPPDDFLLNGNMQSLDQYASVLIYSSTEIVTGTRSGKNPINGQIYGCKLNLQGAARINFVPVGSALVAMKRDLG